MIFPRSTDAGTPGHPTLFLGAAVLWALVAGGPGVLGQAPLVVPGAAANVELVDDPVTGWNLSRVYVPGSPPGTEIPLRNIPAGVPLWSLRVFDGTADLRTIDPKDPGAGAVVTKSGTIVGPLVALEWTITYPSGSLQSVTVSILIGAPPGSAETLWWGAVNLVPRAGFALSLENFEFPRLAIGALGFDQTDKLVVPVGEGALVSHYTSAAFHTWNFEELHDPNSARLSLQQWAAYRIESSATHPGITLDHGLSQSQLLLFGSRDAQGHARRIRVETLEEPGGGSRYLLWAPGTVPEGNRDPSPSPTNYLLFDPATQRGYLWSIGALPAGSDWSDAARQYRDWATSVPWWYDGGDSGYRHPIGHPRSQVSPAIRDAALLLVYHPYSEPGVCGPSFHDAIADDLRAFRSLLVEDLQLPATMNRIATLHYAHLMESILGEGSLDRYLSLSNPAALTPFSNPSWRAEIAAAAAGVPGFSIALHTPGEIWDTRAPSWAGNPPVPPLVPPPAALLPTTACPSPAPPCVPADPLSPPILALRHSPQVHEEGAIGNAFVWAANCDLMRVVCPRSTPAYTDSHWQSVVAYLFALGNTLPSPAASLLKGSYLDNFGSPGTPLCYHRRNPLDPTDIDHQHPRGGGGWHMAGRRALGTRLRDVQRALVDSESYALVEGPNEHWVGMADARGCYLRDTPAYFGNYFSPFGLPPPWDYLNPGIPPEWESAAIPFFNAVWGDYLPSFEWTIDSPERGTVLNIPGPPTAPQNLLPPGVTPPVFPGTTVWQAVCIYNSYDLVAAGVTEPAGCFGVDNSGTLPTGMPPAFYAVQGRIGVINEPPNTAATQWDNVLWVAASLSYLQDAFDFSFKISLTSFNFRQSSPLYPYHRNPDPNLPQALVADGLPWIFKKRLLKTKSDWKAYWTLGPRLGQPVVEPSVRKDWVRRVAREMLDVSFGSCHGLPDTNGDAIIVVVNWTPWVQEFDVHFDPAESGFPGAPPTQVIETEPDVGLPFATPVTITTLVASPLPNRLVFRTSPIPGASVRVYRLRP